MHVRGISSPIMTPCDSIYINNIVEIKISYPVSIYLKRHFTLSYSHSISSQPQVKTS